MRVQANTAITADYIAPNQREGRWTAPKRAVILPMLYAGGDQLPEHKVV